MDGESGVIDSRINNATFRAKNGGGLLAAQHNHVLSAVRKGDGYRGRGPDRVTAVLGAEEEGSVIRAASDSGSVWGTYKKKTAS
jgi:hypothetical protein